MYSIVPLQHYEFGTVFGYAVVLVALAAIIALMLTGESARKTLPLCFASFCIAGFIILVIPPAPAPEIGYDVTALGSQPWFNPSRSYITARGVSEAVGRPVGNADMITCDDQQDMENNRRPVSYLADDGIIRQGMLNLDKSKPEWKITLTDSKGKPIPRPAHRIGAKSELSAASEYDGDSLAPMAGNWARGCVTVMESRYSVAHASPVFLQADDGSTVSITGNHHGGGVIADMDDGKGPKKTRMILLGGKAYLLSDEQSHTPIAVSR